MDDVVERSQPSARERLIRFIEVRGLSQADLGKTLECSQALVSKIVRGDRKPGLSLAFKIERATKGWDEGQILARDWTDEGEPLAAPLAATGTDPV